MTAPNVDAEALARIRVCAADLRALGGGVIPMRWKQAFLRAIMRIPKRRGRKRNLDRDFRIAVDWYEAVSAQACYAARSGGVHIAQDDEEEATPPGLAEDLAKRHGVSASTVRRIMQRVRADEAREIEVMSEVVFRALELE